MARLIVAGAAIALMAVSVLAVAGIPFGPFLGLDFHNLDAFHGCVARNNPYLSTGAECGDVGARDMFYPPLLYWSFAWTRLLPLSAGALLWAAVVLGGVLVATLAWVPGARRGIAVYVFIGLLMLQYPLLFAMERGNNDVLVLLLWTAAVHLFLSGRPGWSGLVAGTAVALKLYPAFAAIVVGCGLIWWAWRERTMWRRLALFTAGGLAAVGGAVLVAFEQTTLYLADEMQRLTAMQIPLSAWTHTLDHIAPAGNPWLLSLPLLAVWIVASARQLPHDPLLVFAGALALSTYFSSVSYDYNLITAYPLLMLLFVRAIAKPWSLLASGLLLVGLFSVVGNRDWFMGSESALRAHIASQWLWLVATGLAVASGRLRLPGAEASAEPDDVAVLRAGNTPPTLLSS